MNRRLKAKSKAKSLAGSGSWQGKNSAQAPKLQDKKKEKRVVEDSVTQLKKLQLEDTTTSEKKTCESKECLNNVEPISRVCLKVGHWACYCPYHRRVPNGVTEVGKGYVIACLRCPAVRNKCKHNIGRTILMKCYICKVFGHHVTVDCPELKTLTKENSGKEGLTLYI